VAAAVGWGALAASSLVLGVLLAFARTWSKPQLGAVLAFGAGALISSVSFELAQEGIEVGGAGATGAGLAAGALVYFFLDEAIARHFATGRGRRGRAEGSDTGNALMLGAFLDGVPEQLVLGIGIAAAGTVSPALLIAIFVSNLPEAMGSAQEMQGTEEREGVPRRTILALWLLVAVIGTAAAIGGYALADSVSGEAQASIDGFAAGALLVMLIDSMIPDARADLGRVAGLLTVLGFAVAAGLSTLA
jgi:zinc transporter, ZIP family